jgi:LysR family nitrogen assimilation transcriptional regulator
MDVRQLELFLAVMDSSGVTRAAEKVYLSPGAVSVQIHSLAGELKTDLFVRSGKRIVPTPQAFRLAEHARGVLAKMRAIEQEFASDPAKDERPFHFATGATTLIHRLGGPLRQVRKKYPRTEITVTVAATEEMVAGVLDRRFDLALISLPFPEENLRILPLFEEELLGLRPAPSRGAASAIASLAPDALQGVPFLLYPKRSNMRSIIERFFADIGVNLRVVMEADDTEVIKRLVESGFGYAILPRYALRGPHRTIQTFRVAGHKLVRNQALAMPKSEYPRALTESIAKFLQAALTPSPAAAQP